VSASIVVDAPSPNNTCLLSASVTWYVVAPLFAGTTPMSQFPGVPYLPSPAAPVRVAVVCP
jgi:hypothetical protein